MSVKEGDEVMIPAYGGQEIKLNKEKYILFRESDLLAVFQ
jgi:co-chaperonin GroES (HSP10)